MSPRLALIDLVSSNRTKVYRTQFYPFIQALARQRGFDVNWLCAGVDSRAQAARDNPFIFHLPAEELEPLCARLRQLRPDRAVINERLDPSSWEAVKQALGGAPMEDASVHVASCLGGGELDRAGQPRPRYTDLELDPDHGRELLTPLARRIKPHVFVMLGSLCLYRRPLSRNPHFQGVDLSGCTRDDSCSFCTPPLEDPPPGDLVDSAMRQILAAERTTPEACRSRGYVINGAALWFRVGRFLDALLASDLPPSDFFFHCRADDLVRRAEEVERRLPALNERGLAINIFSIGVENFSPVENERFNKGIEAATVLEAAELMYRWEQRYPRAFAFSSHGGFAFILFTPWTTLDDLEVNLRWLRRARPYWPDVVFALRTRLQLLNGRPLTELARRDGVVGASFDDDHLFDSGCITSWDDQETPWRFLGRRVALLYRLSRRLGGDPALPQNDPDLWRVARWMEKEIPAGRSDPLDLMQRAVALVGERPEIRQLDELMAALAGEFEAEDRAQPLSQEMGSYGTQVCVRGPCNLACLFCNLYSQRTTLDPAAHQEELLEELERLGERGVRKASWGIYHHEPTTFPGLPALLRRARELGIDENLIITNAVRTADRRYCRELQEAGATGLVVTLVEYDAESADALCQGEGVMEARRRTFQNCQEVGLEVYPVLLLMRANYKRVADALDLYADLLGDKLFTVQPVQPSMHERVAWFLPPLTGMMEEVVAAARRVAPRQLRLVNIPECIQRRFAEDLPNATFRKEREGRFPAACAGCHDREDCCGLSPEYLDIYGAAEVEGEAVLHSPISLERLSSRCALDITRRQEEGAGRGAASPPSRKLLAVLQEILQAAGDSPPLERGFTAREVTLAHHKRVEVVLARDRLEVRFLVAWRAEDEPALLKAGPFALMLPAGESATPGKEKVARILARALVRGWRRGPG